MSPKVRLIVFTACVVGVALVGWLGYERMFAQPAHDLRASIAKLRNEKTGYETALLEENRINRELAGIVASAVHGDRESLEHRLRTACATLAFEAGLTRLEVNSQPPRLLGNPAARARGMLERDFQRTLRDRVDASEARVVVSGEGPLEVVLRALAMAEAQRWTIGVDSWSIKPMRVDAGSPALFALTMTLAVLVVVDEGALAGEIPIDAMDDRVLARVGSMVRADPFRTAPVPAPVVAVAPDPQPVEPVAPPAPPPAGDGWRLAGVLEGESGRYAIVVHQSGRRRTLALGEEVGGLRLASVLGEVATFEADEKRFEVRNGEALTAARGKERP